jgi:hypothetical protein
MNSNRLHRRLAAVAILLLTCAVICTIGAERSAAQCCPTYKVQIFTLGGCASLTIATTWTGGGTWTNTYNATGSHTETAPAPGCFPGPLAGITVNGNALGTCPGNVMLLCGCVRVCSVVDDETGCVVITVTNC